MQLLIRCDGCGVTGTAEEIQKSDGDDDLCPKCFKEDQIQYLKDKIEKEKQLLETTYLKNIRNWEQEIADLEKLLQAYGGV